MIELQQAKAGAYDSAQDFYVWQFVVLVVIPFALAVLRVVMPAIASYVAGAGVGLFALDVLLLDRKQKERKTLAAKCQEDFDCRLFGLPWRTERNGPRPTPEEVHTWARRHPERAGLADWYPKIVAALPRQAAVAVCQRANGSWNAEMRERYAARLRLTIITLGIAFLMLAMVRRDEVLTLVTWAGVALPVFTWVGREAVRQREAAESSRKIAERARKLWQRVKGGDDPTHVETELRELQNDIFDQRKRDPQQFHWVYRRYRTRDEETMHAAAARLVREYESAERPA